MKKYSKEKQIRVFFFPKSIHRFGKIRLETDKLQKE